MHRVLSFLRHSRIILTRLAVLLGVAAALRFSQPPASLEVQTAFITAGRNFNFLSWTADALGTKLLEASAAPQNYVLDDHRSELVRAFFDDLATARALRRDIERAYTDPATSLPAPLAVLEADEAVLRAGLAERQPLVEAILQEQVAAVVADAGFGVLGQQVPPLNYHMTPLPRILVISQRDRIAQAHAVSIDPTLSLASFEAIEAEIEAARDVSALIVPIGGLAIYPAMVYETSNLAFLIETIAHEWAHHWLFLRPLGVSYGSSETLRVMNETTASLFGKEIAQEVYRRYYPELVAPPETAPPTAAPEPPAGDVFDFRAEMRITRVRVDELLAAGEVEAAEAYMEQRRLMFVENGYALRKLNQAYFAFHGAYADEPGAAGDDPIGPMVVALREQSASLKAFMQQIAWITTVDELEARVN